MSIHRKISSLVVTTALASTALIGSASTASAATCYGSAHSYSKPADSTFLPNIGNGHFRTTSNCADINIKTNADRYIRVCFVPSSGGTQCQDDFKLARRGVWTVIATDVRDATKFAFVFEATGVSTGYWAA
ncbi:hypothetical protein ACIBBB_04475 [Streptomyces sp. NPDC051217]|uniref:hypothetical protein n=1 Tax=Streptomyces sp. NPDC051217 TaxID=3365644 RepID=UPI0037B38F31